MLILLSCFYYYDFLKNMLQANKAIQELASTTTANFLTYITFKIYPKVIYYTRL